MRGFLIALVAQTTAILMLTCYADGGVIMVDTLIDELEPNGLCSLREAIAAVNEKVNVDTCTEWTRRGDNIIMLPAGYYSLWLGDIWVTAPMIIRGDPEPYSTVIDAQHLSQILVVDVTQVKKVRLEHLTLYRGINEPGGPQGAAVEHNQGHVVLDNTIVLDSVGNAVFSERSTRGIRDRLVIKDSTIVHNQDYSGSAVHRQQGHIHIWRSMISDNTTIPGYVTSNDQAAGLTLYKGKLELHDAVIDSNMNTSSDPVEHNCELGLPDTPGFVVTRVEKGVNTLGEGCVQPLN